MMRLREVPLWLQRLHFDIPPARRESIHEPRPSPQCRPHNFITRRVGPGARLTPTPTAYELLILWQQTMSCLHAHTE